MRLFVHKISCMAPAEEASLRRLGYRADGIRARIAELTQQPEEVRQPFFGGLDYAMIRRRL